MPTKFDSRLKDSLLTAERQAALQPRALLRGLGLSAGERIADIGCGPGFFALPAADLVGSTGLVLAADIQGEMLSALKSRALEQGYANIRLYKMNDTDVPLPAASCDLVLAAFVLDEVPGHASFLRRLARLITPGGHVAVVEWQKIEQPEGPSLADRIAPDELIADAHAAGLRLHKRRDIGESYYLCSFRHANSDN